MSNLEQMTNAELNVELLRLVSKDWLHVVISDIRPANRASVKRDGGVKYDAHYDTGDASIGLRVNYCVDGRVTMPLVFKHGLEIGHHNGLHTAVKKDNHRLSGYTIGKDPMRTIVICLIKVLGGEK